MKKLIFIDKNSLKDTGGPIGYCNNLYKELNLRGEKEIDFLNLPTKKASKVKDILKKIKILKSLKKVYFYFKLIYGKKHYSQIDLNKYDIIHFHLTQDMFAIRDSLKDYKGKIILTSHSPTIASKELIIDATKIEKFMFSFFKKKLIRMDEYAFNRADYLIFPCQEAMEPYINDWDKFSKIIEEKKIYYVPTGINGCKSKIDSNEIKDKYNIPKDAFLISYVGRHNEIKGYDQLKILGEKILNEYPDVYFIIAGKEAPLKRLNHKRWIEVGWTNDPHSIIAASNLFVLPNKNTYFDLIALETMSLSVPILFTYTGGNKYLFMDNKGGLFKYNSILNAINIFKTIYNLEKSDLKNRGETNNVIFCEKYTSKKFCDEYLKVIKKIEKDEKNEIEIN